MIEFNAWLTLTQKSGMKVLLRHSHILAVHEMGDGVEIVYQDGDTNIRYEMDIKFDDFHKLLYTKIM